MLVCLAWCSVLRGVLYYKQNIISDKTHILCFVLHGFRLYDVLFCIYLFCVVFR